MSAAEDLSRFRGAERLLSELGGVDLQVQQICNPGNELLSVGAFFDGSLEGVISAGIVPLQAGVRICAIKVFVVRKPHRQIGIGGLLFAEAEIWAAKNDCSAIEMVALPGDRGTKNFCESKGLTARSLIMARRV